MNKLQKKKILRYYKQKFQNLLRICFAELLDLYVKSII